MYPDERRLEIVLRGIDAKLLVTTSNHILVNLADFAGMEEPDCDAWTSKRGRDSEETSTESDMTEGTEETATDPEEVPYKTFTERSSKITESSEKPLPAYIQLSPALQSELRKLQNAAARGSSASAVVWAKVSRAADKALALILSDKAPRSMEISAVYACQDTEFACETETEQWLIEDFHRQRCEVKARRDAKLCWQILTALGRREWKTWNDVPLELRKDIQRIHRNLRHASADQLEKLFRDANVSDNAISALKHFWCDACDRLKQTPSKRSGSESCRKFQ